MITEKHALVKTDSLLDFNNFLIPKYNFIEGINCHSKFIEPHFCSLIVGPPASGKSTLIFNLLFHEKLYKKKFD